MKSYHPKDVLCDKMKFESWLKLRLEIATKASQSCMHLKTITKRNRSTNMIINSNKYESAKDKIRNLIEMEIGSRWQSGKVLAPEQYGDGGTARSWDPTAQKIKMEMIRIRITIRLRLIIMTIMTMVLTKIIMMMILTQQIWWDGLVMRSPPLLRRSGWWWGDNDGNDQNQDNDCDDQHHDSNYHQLQVIRQSGHKIPAAQMIRSTIFMIMMMMRERVPIWLENCHFQQQVGWGTWLDNADQDDKLWWSLWWSSSI